MEDHARPSSHPKTGRDRGLRAGIVLLLFFHLLGGIVHDAREAPVHDVGFETSFTMAGTADEANVALPGNHCHGCFAFFPPYARNSSLEATRVVSVPRWSDQFRVRVAAQPSTPPPKASI
jgi:hypothetical protein